MKQFETENGDLEEAVAFHFAPERAAADAQQPGRDLPVTVGFLQGLLNGEKFAGPRGRSQRIPGRAGAGQG